MRKIFWKIVDGLHLLGKKSIEISIRFIKWLYGAIASMPTKIPPGIPHLVLGIVIVGGFVFLILMGTKWFWQSDIPLIFRDATLALVAHNMAGEPIEAIDIDYTQSCPYYPNCEWGQLTNSEWLSNYSRLIAPYFEWEGMVSRASYPRIIVWMPRLGYSSLRVGGWAWPPTNQVFMNERTLLEKTMINEDPDVGRIISTLTHELIHIQGGWFFESPHAEIGTVEWSQWIESHTEAATVEILAAMCYMGDENACRGFWLTIEDFSRSSLKLRFIDSFGVPGWWIYDRWADLFLRDEQEKLASQKGWRYWMEHYEEMVDILRKYGHYPWEEYVIPGVIWNTPMDTGIGDYCPCAGPGENPYEVLGLKFDDTEALLGIWKYLLYLGK